ncbi:phage tail-like protein [Nakamurella sp. UYEF19]|uniref:phage tail protein n=1 Tax=Nakamurella sp. UYEF19 TaxID=1756392 RepID=UPI003394EC00
MTGPGDGGWQLPGADHGGDVDGTDGAGEVDGAPGASVDLPDEEARSSSEPEQTVALVPRAGSSAAVYGAADSRAADSRSAGTDVVTAPTGMVRTVRHVRRDSRVGPPPRHPQWLINQLPVGMLQSDFFVRFVSIFQELGSKLMDDADLVQHIADSTVTPVPMISHLASWIGVDTIDRSLPEPLQRVILASSAKALAHRGTLKGLRNYLEMLSGGPAEVLDGGGVWPEGAAPGDVAWVRMTVQSTGHLSEDEFVAMVRDEVPAHVRAELWIDVRRVLSTSERGWTGR